VNSGVIYKGFPRIFWAYPEELIERLSIGMSWKSIQRNELKDYPEEW